jgi:hypothetical protein
MDTLTESQYLDTAEQVKRIWPTADIPKKGYRTVLQVPGACIVSITRSDHKSDIGKRLYHVIMTPWGSVPSWQVNK